MTIQTGHIMGARVLLRHSHIIVVARPIVEEPIAIGS
jgi:hypothetical protein